MFKIIEKLENYYVLDYKKDFVIIGTKIVVNEYKEFKESVFQPYSQPALKEFPVFFLLTTSKVISKKEREFRERKLPILHLENNKKILFNEIEMKKILDKYIKERCSS